MRTSTPPPPAPQWFVIDAAGVPLGRLATRIAHVLRGKHKPSFSPHQVMSDHVVVINAHQVVLTGQKADTKVYSRHSGYPGALRHIPFRRYFAQYPTRVVQRAVRGMLPRNRLRPALLRHLHIYAHADHPHTAQTPEPFPVHLAPPSLSTASTAS